MSCFWMCGQAVGRGCSDQGPTTVPWTGGYRHHCSLGGEGGREKQLWERRGEKRGVERWREGQLLLPKAAPFTACPKLLCPLISVPKAAVLLGSEETRETRLCLAKVQQASG